MPGGDRSGPMGGGPLTGGGFGFCRGDSTTRRFSRGGYGGRQGGFGRGRGRRNRFWATGQPGWQQDATAEKGNLEEESASLEAEIQGLTARLEELKS